MSLATEITLDQVEQTYRGRNGCACGCGGEYYNLDDKNINPEKVSKEIEKHIKHINKNISRVKVFVLGRNNEVCLELENPSGTSVTRIYLKTNQ